MKTFLILGLTLGAVVFIGIGVWKSSNASRKPLPTPDEVYFLSKEEVAILEKRSRDLKDSDAAWRLAKFYGFSARNEKLEEQWIQTAAELGNESARRTIKYRESQ